MQRSLVITKLSMCKVESSDDSRYYIITGVFKVDDFNSSAACGYFHFETVVCRCH